MESSFSIRADVNEFIMISILAPPGKEVSIRIQFERVEIRKINKTFDKLFTNIHNTDELDIT